MDTYWASDPQYPLSEWQLGVADGSTRRGYHEWVAQQRAAAAEFEQLSDALGLSCDPAAPPGH